MISAKKVLISEGIPTPAFFEVSDIRNIDGAGIGYPLIVKPKQEGSSKGISDKSIVKNERELKRQAEWVLRTYKQSALVEKFITGSRIYGSCNRQRKSGSASGGSDKHRRQDELRGPVLYILKDKVGYFKLCLSRQDNSGT